VFCPGRRLTLAPHMPGLLDTIKHPADTTAHLAKLLDLFQGRFENFEGVGILPASGMRGNNPLRR
ncbi:hypothetical protein QWA68_016989, partial [Fusarium oxysporum]